MHLAIAHCTDEGGQSSNDDFVGFCATEEIGCFVLADGTGGYRGGALAARTVVNEVLRRFRESPVYHCTRADWSLEVARDALLRARADHPQMSEMNTTLATLLIDLNAGLACWGHLGDSRIYLFRNGRARLLTHDHSVVQAMLDAGYTREPIRGSAYRNALYASVGSEEMPPTALGAAPLALVEGDAFLMCSDGFWDALDECGMEATLQDVDTPEAWVQVMVDMIKQEGGAVDDNFSALAVWVGKKISVTRILSTPALSVSAESTAGARGE